MLFLALPASAVESDLCDIIDIPKCRGITKQLRRNTFQSAPTSSTAANLNPANVRFDRGAGLEAIAQSGNSVLFGVASGTGKMGGALISGSMDNTFFGNRVPEHDEDFLKRYDTDKQFKNQKITAALGAKLFSSRNLGLDVGLIFKRHNEVKKINPGGGFSGRVWVFHFGASMYKDDFNLDMTTINASSGLPYSTIYGKQTFQESFTVTTYTGGLRIKNVALDIASIQSKLDYYKTYQGVDDTRILIYAASIYYNDFLFNAAVRREHSGSKVFSEPASLKGQTDKSEPFYSLQYSIGKHLIIGVSYNYFLLKEASASLAIFI